MDMRHYYPSYFKKFKCIAARCPDSCCKDWDVVVDSETEAFYNTVQSPLGDKLRALTVTDGDGDRVFVSQNGRCPFWNADMLCDIYIELGEDRLCRTCAEFPRITQEYDGFCEHTLSFACPEAARLILAEDNAYSDLLEARYHGDDELLSSLLRARKQTALLLCGSGKPLGLRLGDCLEYNAQIQAVLNGGEPAALDIPEDGDLSAVFELHKRLDYMSADFARLVAEAGDSGLTPLFEGETAKALERLFLYMLFRYYLNAVDSYDVLSTVKRAVCACLVLGVMARNTSDLTALFQRYSKEVEHSYENSEELTFAFAADEAFSSERLITLLDAQARKIV